MVNNALFLAPLMLAGGSLGDHFGRLHRFATSIAVFTLAYGLSALVRAPRTV